MVKTFWWAVISLGYVGLYGWGFGQSQVFGLV